MSTLYVPTSTTDIPATIYDVIGCPDPGACGQSAFRMAQDVGRWREYVYQSWRNADWTRLRLNLVRPSASVSMRPSVAPARQQTVSEHQQRIGEYRRLRTFDAATGERLARFLEDAARRLERTASLLARARAWLRDEHVLAPADSVLRRAVGAARHNARALLTDRIKAGNEAPYARTQSECVTRRTL